MSFSTYQIYLVALTPALLAGGYWGWYRPLDLKHLPGFIVRASENRVISRLEALRDLFLALFEFVFFLSPLLAFIWTWCWVERFGEALILYAITHFTAYAVASNIHSFLTDRTLWTKNWLKRLRYLAVLGFPLLGLWLLSYFFSSAGPSPAELHQMETEAHRRQWAEISVNIDWKVAPIHGAVCSPNGETITWNAGQLADEEVLAQVAEGDCSFGKATQAARSLEPLDRGDQVIIYATNDGQWLAVTTAFLRGVGQSK